MKSTRIRLAVGVVNCPFLLRMHVGVGYKASLPKGEDPLSASMVRKHFLKERCRRWLAGNKYHPSLFPRDSPKQFNVSLKDSVCKTNKTLALIAIDSLHYFHFAERLGIDISKRRNKTTVVILDAAVRFVAFFFSHLTFIVQRDIPRVLFYVSAGESVRHAS